MPLSPQEEQELLDLENQQTELLTQYESLKKEFETPVPMESQSEIGMPEAFARSAAQALTFETADEATARAESVLTGKPYEQALEETRAKYKAAEEQSPAISLLGGIAGGVAQGLGVAALTGGASAPVTGAQTLSKIAKLGQIAKTALLPSTQKGVLKNIGSSALAGATYGGLTEIGASEKEGLERLEEVPRSILTGGIVGGAFGGAVEAGKKTIGAIGKSVNKAIDEGVLPSSFRKIRDVTKAGLEGKGYISEKEIKRIDDSLEDAAEKSLAIINENKNNARVLKKTIISQVDKPIEMDTTFVRFADELAEEANQGVSDATPALNRLQKLVESKLQPDSTSLSATALDDIINKLDDYAVDNPETSGSVQKVLRKGINELKLKLRLAVTSDDVNNVLNQNPELKENYLKYVKNMSVDSLENSPVLSEYEKKFFSGLKKSKTAQDKKLVKEGISPEDQTSQELEAAIKEVSKKKRGRQGMTQEQKQERILEKYGEEGIADILQEIKDISKQNPLGQLDNVLHHILNASETLGIKVKARDPLAQKFKIFDVLRGNTAETGTGQKAVMRYQAAIDELEKANPDIAKQFREVTEPAIKELENRKFLEGTRLGEGPRDQGALKTLVTAPAVATALTGNLLAQATKSSSAKSLMRPSVQFLESLKNKIDDKIVVEPTNPVLKFISKSLENALSEKNEARRAATLNTLMQYETIRKLFEEEKYER
jgi:hypothetical protein